MGYLQKSPQGSLFSISVISSHLRKLGYPEKSIESMMRCQKLSSGGYVVCCDGCDRKDFGIMKHWCCLRTCPYCAKRRQRNLWKKYIDYLKELHKDRKMFLYFLTISPKNYKNLKFGLEDIGKNFSKFRRLKYIKERIKGSLYVIEVKQTWKGQKIYDKKGKFLYISKEDSWNIHVHAIVYGRFLDNRIRGKCEDCGQNLLKFNYENKKHYCASSKCLSTNVIVKEDSKLVRLWKKCSEGQDVNMHITRKSSATHILNYMLKYISASKDSFKDEKGMAEYIVAIRGRRLVSGTGKFYKDKIKPIPYICDCGSKLCIYTSFQLHKLEREAEDKKKFEEIRRYLDSVPLPKVPDLLDYFNSAKRRRK